MEKEEQKINEGLKSNGETISEHHAPEAKSLPPPPYQLMANAPQLKKEEGEGEEELDLSTHVSQGNDGLPNHLKSGIEALSGFSMDDVKVHFNSGKPAQLQAHAYAQGTDIYLAPGQEKHLAHEAWHIVQQKQGRVQANFQINGGIDINDDDGLEKEADIMGEKASKHKPAGGQKMNKPAKSKTIQRVLSSVVQRNYAGLSPMGKARVDQQSEDEYAQAAAEFECNMAPRIMVNRDVNLVVDLLVDKVKNIVDAWATSTGKTEAAAYEQEFGWEGGNAYYGAFTMTAQNIAQVFADKSKPMRTKLKLVYNAVRNNNLAKWLKVAAIELSRQANGQRAKSLKIKTASGNVMERDANGNKTGNLQPGVGLTKEKVKTGFAAASGLAATMTPQQINNFSTSNAEQNLRTGDRSDREIFSHDKFGSMMNWHANTVAANAERTPNATATLHQSEKNSLTVNDVQDLTDEEIDQDFFNKQNRMPTILEKQQYRANPNGKIGWGQGGEYYDVNLGSASVIAASNVKARMEAGISGSTDLMMHALQNLGFTDISILKSMRLGLAAWMMANRDHSFYEVYKAAESYGIPFDIDPADIGSEYESDQNLYPMVSDDFRDVLPTNVFPKHYLSVAHKDQLALGMNLPAKTDIAFKGDLQAQGVDPNLLLNLDERGIAEFTKLSDLVSAENINNDLRLALKMQIVRKIKLSPAYSYIGNVLGNDIASQLLTSLLRSHHSNKGVAPDANLLNSLLDSGISKLILDVLPPAGLLDLNALKQSIGSARYNTASGHWQRINTQVQENRLLGIMSLTQMNDVRSVLFQTYHGSLDPVHKQSADEAREISTSNDSKEIALQNLADANVPRAYIETLDHRIIYDLLKLSQDVHSGGFDITNTPAGILINQQVVQLIQTKFNTLLTFLGGKCDVILSGLIKHHHGVNALSENQKYFADFAQMISSREDRARTGETRELSNVELGNLESAKFTKAGGQKEAIRSTQYWSNLTAKSRLNSNKNTVLTEYKKKMVAQNKEQAYALFLNWSENTMGNSAEILSQQESTLRAASDEELEGYLGNIPDEQINNILPQDIKDNIGELEALNDKELGAIFKYTTAEFVPIVLSANNPNVKDFSKDNVTDPDARKWGNEGGTGSLSTLEYTNPMMKALISGLDKMTAYPGLVYRGEKSNQDLRTKSEADRMQYANNNYPVGKVEFKAYPMSSSTTPDAPKKAPNGDQFDVFYEISNVMTGKSIELLSNSPDEKEVLFAPGARFVITQVETRNAGELWVLMSEI